GISILLAVGTPSTGSGNLYCQWELSPSSGNALCILFPTKHTLEEAATLRELVESERLLRVALASSASGSQSKDTTKKNRIRRTLKIAKETKLEDHPRKVKSSLIKASVVDSRASYNKVCI
nr:hypothetical protein [Tanacetum cinerariifolium]